MNQNTNQVKQINNGLIKAVNCAIDQWNHEWKRNNMEMDSMHNEGKSVVAERFIRTLENKIYRYVTSIWKNVYVDKLDDIVNKYKNTCHRKMKRSLFA